MSPEDLVLALFWSDSVRSLLALAIGFAVAGLLSSGYQLLTLQPPSFRLLHEAERKQALAAVPFLVFAAPFIIVRNTVRGRRIEGRNFGFAALAARRRRLLEPDVRHRRGDGAAGHRPSGRLSSRLNLPDMAWSPP